MKKSIAFLIFILCLLFTSSLSAQDFEIESLYPDQVEMCVGQTFTITPDEVPLNPDSDNNLLITTYQNYVGGPDISANDNTINGNANPTGVITLSSATMAGEIIITVTSYYTNIPVTATIIVEVNSAVLGEYPNTTMAQNANIQITPDILPVCMLKATAQGSGFSGDLLVDPNTGIVTVTNASQPGVYMVDVTGFAYSGLEITRSFQLTVNASNACSTSFNELRRSGPSVTNDNAVIGDFNNDGIQDIANVAFTGGAARLQILLGDDAGNFNATGSQPSFFDPLFPADYFDALHAITTGDFNGDGNLDILVGAYQTIYVHYGNGNGGILSIQTISLQGSQPFILSLASGHFNDDGILDIAVGYSSLSSSFPFGSIRTYYGTGNTAFIQGPTYEKELRYPQTLISRNLNNDALDELIVVYNGDRLGFGQVDESREISEGLQVNSAGELESFISVNAFGVQAVATGDIDGQGTFDVAALTRNGIEIFLNGNVNNQNPNQFIPLDAAYNDIKLINKNGDGFLDLVLSSTSADKVTVLLGDGTGGFTESTSVNVLNPAALTIGDFNADGIQDCLVNNKGNSVLLGVSSELTLSVNNNNAVTELGTTSLKFIRLQNTGDTDLVVEMDDIAISGTDANLFTVIGYADQANVFPAANFSAVFPLRIDAGEPFKYIIVLFEPEAVGTFSAALDINKGNCDNPVTSTELIGICTSDFTGDIGSYQDATITSGENISINSTGGVFEFDKFFATTDVNFDGILSVRTTDGTLTVTNAIRPGVYTIKVSGYNQFERTGFSTEDDDPENWGIRTERDLFQLGDTTFVLTVNDPICSSGDFEIIDTIQQEDVSNLTDVAIGDFNNDGTQDLIATFSNFELSAFADFLQDPGEITDIVFSSFIKLGAGDGSFGLGNELNRYMTGFDPRAIKIDDYNGDGIHDIVAANSDAIGNVFTRTGLGFIQFELPFKAPPAGDIGSDNGNIVTPPGSAYSKDIAFGDFNDDGLKDFAIVSAGAIDQFTGLATPSFVSIQVGDGFAGTGLPIENHFEEHAVMPSGVGVVVGNRSVSIVVSDFNGDGIQDFATASANENKISVRLGIEGNGVFTETGQFFQIAQDVAVGEYPSSLAKADFNGDGIIDLAVACRGSQDGIEIALGDPDYDQFSGIGSVFIRLGNGNGTFSGSVQIPVGINPSNIKIGDFNGDGNQDFAVTNTNSNDVSIRFGNGDGTFYGTSQIEVAEGPVKLVVGDFNEDRIQDLAVASTNSISILQGIPTGVQELALTANGITIENNDSTPSLEDNTDFGNVVFEGNSRSNQFSIENTGDSPITLAEGAISVDGTDSALFGLSDINYPIFIEIGEAYNFNIDFEPTFEGEKTAVVTVTYGSCVSTNTASFAVKATVVPPPVLGNYPETSIVIGANSLVIPDATPINTLRAIAFTDSSFKGSLFVNPSTGEVAVTNASLSGTYTVTVQAFTVDNISTSTTFTLTVNPLEQCITTFNTIADAPFSATGNAPTAIVVGDFNTDGIQDIINANTNSDFLSLKFGNGSDGFSGSTTIPVPLNTSALAVNDINGDGFLDVVAVNTINAEVYAILGNGDGTFQTALVIAVGADPGTIALGDLNSDGIVDMALSNALESTVHTLLGDGTGNFVSDATLIISTTPKQVILGDFNSDTHLDIATANYDTNSVAVSLGNGDGSFETATNISVGQGPSSLIVGDFNNDNIQDMATANAESLTILIGDDTGGFITATEIMTSGISSIKIGEFNGDGIQDIVSKPLLGNQIKIYTGDGTGAFSEFYTNAIGSNMSSLAIGDFNSDGLADVALTSVGPEFITLLTGAGPEINLKGNTINIADGETITAFENNTNFGRVQTGETVVKTFTIENNGNSNLVLPVDAIFLIGGDVADFSISNITLPANILPNETLNFDIEFSPTLQGVKETTVLILNNDCKTSDYDFTITGEGGAFSLPDYNTDLSAHSVIAGNNLSIYPNTDDLPINIVSAIAYVDYSGGVNVPNFEGTFKVDPETGVLNVINAKPEGVYTVKIIGLQNLSSAAEQTKTITLTVNPPICSDGTFIDIQNELNGGRSLTIAEGDFNGDGIIDIVSSLESNFTEAINGVNINLGNPDGTFQNPQFITIGSRGIAGISVSDFNGDGHQDLLTRATGRMYINLGAGDGSFGASLNFPINSYFEAHAVGDFNNDGKQDIVLLSPIYTNILTLLSGNGDGTFVAITSDHAFGNSKELKVGDFNGNGNLDIIALDRFGGIQFHRGLGNGNFYHNSAIDIDHDGLSAYYTMGDFNNDGISDIAVSSEDNSNGSEPGSFKIYFGNGNFYYDSANYSAGPAIPIDYNEIRSLHAGDFNGDGNQDILVNNKDVMFGAGDGTFPVIPIIEVDLGIGDFQVAIGDFNKDGKQDYVSLQRDFEVFIGAGRVAVFSANASVGDVYLNDGATNPSEQSNTVFETCVNTTVAKTYTIENRTSTILTITDIYLTGDSTGSFVLGDLDDFPTTVDPNSSTTFAINFLPISTDIITATLHIENNDCNDQDFDFVIEGQGIAPQSESSVGTYTTVSMQSGANITVQPDIPASGAALNTRAYTDADFKGVLSVNPVSGDVMITNAYPAGTYLITVEALGVCTSASSIFQLVVDNPACSSATFENVPVFEYDSAEYNKEVYVADFNEDGIQDVVITNTNPSHKMRIQLGNGDGTFTMHEEIIFEGPRIGHAYLDLAIGDFNGDGHIDITATANRRLSMYLGDGAGNFNLATVLVVDNLIGQFAIAEDFNNDGKLDILVKEVNTTTDETKLAIFLGNGIDGFSLKRDIFIDARQVSVGDFNHDGFKDLVVASSSDNRVYVLSGDGLAGFLETAALDISGPNALVVSDFNNDGEQDIAVSAYDLVPNPDLGSPVANIIANQRVELYNGSSSGVFSSTPSSVLPLFDDPNFNAGRFREMKAGDFNADGNADLVIAYSGALPSLPLLLGNGSGSFTLFSNSPVDFTVGNLAIGDFNADGRQDIMTTTLFGSESTNIFFGAGAKIAVKGNDNPIEDGSSNPVILNATDFGETCPTGSIVKTFTIENKGVTDLVLDAGAITISGGDADQFTIGAIPLPVTIATNEATTFTVTFIPDAIGVATTTVTIASNDCSSDAYDFSINATATIEEFEPPVIVCPTLATVYYTNANTCYTIIPLVVTATDNCTLEPTLTSNTPLNNQFPIGDTTVEYTATDANGNTATCEFVITVVDAIAPSIICAEPATVAYGASLDPEDIGSPEVTDNCLVENVALTYTESSTQGTEGCTVYNYTINRFWTATDASGNTSLCVQVINVVDETGPTIIPQDFTVSLDATGTVSITADQIDNGSSDNCGIDSLVLDTTSFDCSNIGDNTVTLSVTDANGNVSTATAIVTVVDDILPEAIAQDITVFLDASGNASITADQIDNGSNDNCGIASVSIDNTSFDCSTIGANSVLLTVTDNNGNAATATATVIVESISVPEAFAQDLTVTLDATGTVNITADQIDNGSNAICGAITTAVDVISFSCADIGENTVTLTVTDGSNNVATATAIVTVVDDTLPEAIAQDITVTLDATGTVSITAEAIDNGSNDNCGIASVSIDNTSFDCSTIGTNSVLLTVTDNNGNAATATATVIVESSSVPVAIAKDITVILNASGTASIIAGNIDDGSNAACGNVIITADTTSFGCDNVGENTVLLTVTDEGNNTSTATAIVTVVDATLPEAIAQDITVTLDANGIATITPEAIDNGSNDACGVVSLELDITTFNTEDIGENTVQLTVTDTNGNVSVVTAIVTVVDESLGIDDIALDLGLSVYPNPTQGSLNLKITNFNKADLSYQLFSLQGQLLLRKTINNDMTEIPMDRLSEGVYVLKVNLNNKEIKSFKIIKKE